MRARRAILNSIAGLLDYGARILLALILAPVMVRYLGADSFGIWQVMLKLGDQIMPADGRPQDVIRWRLATLQGSEADDEKRRIVAGSFAVWLMFFPLLLLCFWLSCQYLLNLDQSTISSTAMLTAFAVVFIATVVASSKLFAGGVLYGENLTYKAMGVMAFSVVMGGVLSLWLVIEGFGLTGAALGYLAGVLFGCVACFFIARKHVGWFGFPGPSFSAAKDILPQSSWFMAWAFVEAGLIVCDVLLIGYAINPEMVSRYVISSYAIQSVITVVFIVVIAALPGVGSLIAEKQFDRAREVRSEGMRYALFLGAACAVVVLLLNQSFVALWVDASQFIGALELLFIVVAAQQMLLIRSEAAFINLALDIRRKTLIAGVSLAISISVALLLVEQWGVIGVCLGLMSGRLVLSFMYPRIVSQFLGGRVRSSWRLPAVVFAAVACAWYFGQQLVFASWLSLIGAAIVLTAVSLLVLFYLGFSTPERALLYQRFLPFYNNIAARLKGA